MKGLSMGKCSLVVVKSYHTFLLLRYAKLWKSDVVMVITVLESHTCWILRLRSDCRQMWPKSDFLALKWVCEELKSHVIWLFQMPSGPHLYLVLNPIQVWSLGIWLNSQVTHIEISMTMMSLCTDSAGGGQVQQIWTL